MLAMKPLLFFVISLSLPVSLAINVSGVRDVPERIVHSRTNPTTASAEPSAASRSPLLLMGVVPDTRVKSKTDYIKEYLAFSSLSHFRILSTTDNAPLKTKFTNLERILSDDTDLREWMRFIVEDDRDEDFVPVEESPDAECIDLKIDDFIDYLVKHRGFCREDLQFLHDSNFDSDYDSIDEELTALKANYLARSSPDAFFRSSGRKLDWKGFWLVTATIVLSLI
ncbi:hypothetical protein OXX69_004169 [Metschnikowia pulcherrima]